MQPLFWVESFRFPKKEDLNFTKSKEALFNGY